MIIILAVLCICSPVIAGQKLAWPAPAASSEQSVATTVPANIFATSGIRPAFDLAHVQSIIKTEQAPELPLMFAHYCRLLSAVTCNPSEQTLQKLLTDDTIHSALFTPLAYSDLDARNYHPIMVQQEMWAIITAAYLHQQKIASARGAIENALAITEEAGLADQFGNAQMTPLVAFLTKKVLKRMPSEQRQQDILTTIEQPYAGWAKDYFKRITAAYGPWTSHDAYMYRWCSEHWQGKVLLVPPAEYQQVAQKIEQCMPHLTTDFLCSQFQASQRECLSAQHIRATARNYIQRLRKKGQADPREHILQTLAIIGEYYNDYDAALELGSIFTTRAFRSSTTQRKEQLFGHAAKFLNIVIDESDNLDITYRALLERARIPAPGKESQTATECHHKQTIKNFETILRTYPNHPLNARTHALLALQYEELLLFQEKNTKLKERYQQKVKLHKAAIGKKDPVANNLILCKEVMTHIANKDEISPDVIKQLDMMLASSITKAEGACSPATLDEVIAKFDHTINFYSPEHAATAWGMRGCMALFKGDFDLCQKCFIQAYTLDATCMYVQNIIQEYFEGWLKDSTVASLSRIEDMLNQLDAGNQNPFTSYFRGEIARQRGQIPEALQMFQIQGAHPRSLHAAGTLYEEYNILDEARRCYAAAAKLQPTTTQYVIAQARIAGKQGRYDEQHTLLMDADQTKPHVIFDLVNLLRSGKVKIASSNEILTLFNCVLILNSQASKKDQLDADTAELCHKLATCYTYQCLPASADDTRRLLKLANEGFVEAYDALASQQLTHIDKLSSAAQQAPYRRMARIYLEKALTISPNCNYIKLKLAKLVMSLERFQKIDMNAISQADQDDLNTVCTWYEEIIASPEADCYVREAYGLYANVLLNGEKNYERAEQIALQGVEQQSPEAFLTLTQVYIDKQRDAELIELLEKLPTLDLKFHNEERKKGFYQCIDNLNRTIPANLSAAAQQSSE
jgi:hypothetical protein